MRYVLRKLVLFVVTLWAAITLNFLLPRLMPGSPVDAVLAKLSAGGQPVTDAQRRAVEIQLGSPHGNLVSQYVDYLGNVVRFRFGTSFSFPTETVGHTILTALPWTLLLVGITTIVAFVIGTLLGLVIGLGLSFFLRTHSIVELPDIFFDRALPVKISPPFVALVAVTAFAIVLLAAFFPARAAARQAPLEGIRSV